MHAWRTHEGQSLHMHACMELSREPEGASRMHAWRTHEGLSLHMHACMEHSREPEGASRMHGALRKPGGDCMHAERRQTDSSHGAH